MLLTASRANRRDTYRLHSQLLNHGDINSAYTGPCIYQCQARRWRRNHLTCLPELVCQSGWDFNLYGQNRTCELKSPRERCYRTSRS